eukprot:637159-Pleurochrysis_carterae.AAC.1
MSAMTQPHIEPISHRIAALSGDAELLIERAEATAASPHACELADDGPTDGADEAAPSSYNNALPGSDDPSRTIAQRVRERHRLCLSAASVAVSANDPWPDIGTTVPFVLYLCSSAPRDDDFSSEVPDLSDGLLRVFPVDISIGGMAHDLSRSGAAER